MEKLIEKVLMEQLKDPEIKKDLEKLCKKAIKDWVASEDYQDAFCDAMHDAGVGRFMGEAVAKKIKTEIKNIKITLN